MIATFLMLLNCLIDTNFDTYQAAHSSAKEK